MDILFVPKTHRALRTVQKTVARKISPYTGNLPVAKNKETFISERFIVLMWLYILVYIFYEELMIVYFAFPVPAASRLHDFDVRVGYSEQPSNTGFFNGSLCRHRSGAFVTSCQEETYVCPALFRGSFVSVQVILASASDNILNFAEISIAGYLL